MRSILLITALVFGLSAQAESLQPLPYEVLTQVLIDGENQGQHTALLTIDENEKEIQLEIYGDMCGQLVPSKPDEIKCMAAAVHVQTLTVPMLETFVDACGSRHSIGEKDGTPYDGLHNIIKVTDHSERKCKDIVESKLIVEATSYNPWLNITTRYSIMK